MLGRGLRARPGRQVSRESYAAIDQRGPLCCSKLDLMHRSIENGSSQVPVCFRKVDSIFKSGHRLYLSFVSLTSKVRKGSNSPNRGVG